MAVRKLLVLAVMATGLGPGLLARAVMASTQLVAQHSRHGLEGLVAGDGRHGREKAAGVY